MQKKLLAALLGAVLVLPVAAHAEGSYFKVGVGQSEYKAFGDTENKTAASLAYGFAIDKNFGVELGYLNFGKLRWATADSSLSLQNQSVYLAGIGSIQVTDDFSLYGKLGVSLNHAKVAVSTPGFSGSDSESTTRPLIGLGLSYNFTKEIAGTLEYTHVGKIPETQIKMSLLTLGVKYGF